MEKEVLHNNVDPSLFEFVQIDSRITDTKMATKKIGYFKDAFIRFCRNKASIAASAIILILVLYIGREIVCHQQKDNIAIFAHIAGGLCGSLFAFLATPKQKATSTTKKVTSAKKSEETTSSNKTKKPTTSSDDTTVVGSIEL